MTTAKIYKTTVRDEPKWCLQWITPLMPAPSFWYYETEAEAIQARDEMEGKKATEQQYLATCEQVCRNIHKRLETLADSDTPSKYELQRFHREVHAQIDAYQDALSAYSNCSPITMKKNVLFHNDD